jgi:hypothetical protein
MSRVSSIIGGMPERGLTHIDCAFFGTLITRRMPRSPIENSPSEATITVSTLQLGETIHASVAGLAFEAMTVTTSGAGSPVWLHTEAAAACRGRMRHACVTVKATATTRRRAMVCKRQRVCLNAEGLGGPLIY